MTVYIVQLDIKSQLIIYAQTNVDLATSKMIQSNFALTVTVIVKSVMVFMLKIAPNVPVSAHLTTFTSKCVLIPVLMDTMLMILQEFVKFVLLACSVQHAKLTTVEMFSAKPAAMDTTFKLIKPAQQDAINTSLKMNGTIAVMPVIRIAEIVQVLMLHPALTVGMVHTFYRTQLEGIV